MMQTSTPGNEMCDEWRWRRLGDMVGLSWDVNESEIEWKRKTNIVIHFLKVKELDIAISMARNSSNGLYKELILSNGANYFAVNIAFEDLCQIFKIRCNLLSLNDKPWRSESQKNCSLCNLEELEDVEHFLGRCPIIKHIRYEYLGSYYINKDEMISWLNGRNWLQLSYYVKFAFNYRRFLVSEFNF